MMNEYPPGNYISDGIRTLPPAGPDSGFLTVEIDAGPGGKFRVTFKAMENPRYGMRSSRFWTMETGERVAASE